MVDTFRNIVISSLAALLLALAFISIAPAAASAQTVRDNICGGTDISFDNNAEGCKAIDKCAEKNRKGQCVAKAADQTLNRTIQSIVNLLTIIVGVVAVAFLVIAGGRFVASGGDSAKVTSARNTAIYAIVGLIIVALAQIIVRFVLSKT